MYILTITKLSSSVKVIESRSRLRSKKRDIRA